MSAGGNVVASATESGVGARAGALAVVMVLVMLGEASYWITFLGTDAMDYPGVPCFRAYDLAFPAANLWTTLAAGVTAHGLWRLRPSAVLFGIVCGSSLIYLGLLDVMFYLGNGMYGIDTGAMWAATFINAFCLTVGPATIAWVWRHRAALGA